MDYGCIGEKLTHSFSKEIHAALFDYDYKIVEVSKDKLDEFMKLKDFKAINVTIPYKQDVIPYLDNISDTARAVGAVNTIVNRNGRLYGYNTDFAGMTALIKLNGIEICGKKVLILGSGGTSKTAVAVAENLGAASVRRVSRTAKDDCITYEQAYGDFKDSEIIINTTPCGMYPDIIGEPVNLDRFCKAEAVIDAIYNPLRSNLVVSAQLKGVKAVGGLYMLVAQAAFAAELFTGQSVSDGRIYDVYKKIISAKRNIVLIGMPSCGKTTVGAHMADKLNMRFVDTDKEIERLSGKTIPEIFEQSGESGFRDLESDVILRVSADRNCVISTGGGAVLRKQNIKALKGNGTVYFIDRPLDLLGVTEGRPLSNNRGDLARLYNERYDLYCAAADKRVINDGEINDVINAVKEDFLK